MKNKKFLSMFLLCAFIIVGTLNVFSVEAKASTISSQWKTYSKSQSISFNYSGANKNNNAWIGIYKTGTEPGKDNPALAWKYVPANSGSITFTPNDFINAPDSPQKGLPLARGKYAAYLFKDGGYNIQASYEFWIEGSDPKISFEVISDFHLKPSNADAHKTPQKLENALNDINKYSLNSKAIIVNGDAVDSSTSGYNELKNVLTTLTPGRNYIEKLPALYFNIGNHELYYDIQKKYTGEYNKRISTFADNISQINSNKNIKNGAYSYRNYGNKPYFKTSIGGYNFIFLASEGQDANGKAQISREQLSWLDSTIYSIAKYQPNEPIFVFSHESLQNTVGGSSKSYINIDSDLRWYLNKYPTVTLFTSHTHSDMKTTNWSFEEKKASKGSGVGMTIFNSSSVGDVWKYGSSYGSQGDSQGLHVDVYDNSIVVRARDFENKRWIGEYTVDLTAKSKSLASSNIG